MSLLFNGELTSLYNCDEVSGPIQDSIGTKHFVTANGGTFNGNSITFDGVNDDQRSDVFSSGNIPITAANINYTVYMHITALSAIGALNERLFYPPLLSATFEGPILNLGFGATIGDIGIDSAGEGTASNTTMLMGRDFNVDEEYVVTFSYNFATKTMAAAFRSLSGLALSDSDTGTSNFAMDANDFYRIMNNADTNYSHVELHEMGIISGGTAKTEGELVAVLADWAGVGGAAQLVSPIISRIISKPLSRIL